MAGYIQIIFILIKRVKMKFLCSSILSIFLILNISANSLLLKEKDLKFIHKLYQDNNYQLTISEIDNFLRKYPSADEIEELLYLKGESLFLTEKYEEMTQLYKQFQATYPKSDYTNALKFRQGLSFFYLKQYDQSLNSFKSLYNENSKEIVSLSHYWSGVIRYQQGKYHEALNHFSYYLQSDHNEYYDYCLYSKAKIFQILNEYDSAINAALKITNLSPPSSLEKQAKIILSELYYQSNQFEKSIEYTNQLLAEIPNNQDYLLFLKGNNQIGLKQYNPALKTYQEILTKYPDSDHRINIFSNTLHIYYLNKQYSNGVQKAIQILEMDQNQNDLFYYWYLMCAIYANQYTLIEKNINILAKKNRALADEILYQYSSYQFNQENFNQAIQIISQISKNT